MVYEQIVLKSNENISNIMTLADDFPNNCIKVDKGRVVIGKKYFMTQAKTFAEHLVRDYVFFLVSLYIYECEFEFTKSNRLYIVNKITESINKDPRKLDIIQDKLKHFAKICHTISIDGFMRFSMRELADIVLDLADIYIDEILFNP